jgi:RNA polymerase sigma factor (sigma-70 family)
MVPEAILKNDLRDKALLHLDALWQTSLWFAANDHDAEDVIMSTYVEASKLWDEPVSEEASKTQMFRILMKMLFGKARLNFRAHLPESFENMSNSSLSGKISEFETIPKDVIIRAIKNLPVEIRLVMVLSIFEKFSYQNIAEIIGVHKRSVRLSIYQGYMLLRRDLINSFAAGYDKIVVE